MKRIITSREMNILDRNTAGLGVPTLLLMEMAGSRLADAICYNFKLKKGAIVTLFCGGGNNGGDGFVAARHLTAREMKTIVVFVGSTPGTEIARKNFELLSALQENVDIIHLRDLSANREKIAESNIIVDGLLGTGVRGKIREPVNSAIVEINKIKTDYEIPVVAIDIPSGMNPDTGEVPDISVEADLIVTFHALKPALEHHPYITDLQDITGVPPKVKDLPKVIVANIGIPPQAESHVGVGDLSLSLPKRNKNAHKGQYGKLLVIGGSKEYSGAPALAALAAVYFGVDLVTVFTVQEIANVIRGYSPNLIVRSGSQEYLETSDIETVKPLVEWADSIVIGPGLGRDPVVLEFLTALLDVKELHEKPLVFDADALTLLGEHNLVSNVKQAIMTPHKVELEKLMGKTAPKDGEIVEFAQKHNLCLLVKGPVDKITWNGNLRLNKTGCPEMAAGGTGDVLCGLSGAFLTVQNTMFDAACCAAYLNGLLGEAVKSKHGSRVVSLEMIHAIPEILKKFEK